jgi:Lar family restriction alleviation protein
MTLRADLHLDFCPFCGGERARVHEWNQRGLHYRGQCLTLGCGAQGPMRHTSEEAIEAWNKRCVR